MRHETKHHERSATEARADIPPENDLTTDGPARAEPVEPALSFTTKPWYDSTKGSLDKLYSLIQVLPESPERMRIVAQYEEARRQFDNGMKVS